MRVTVAVTAVLGAVALAGCTGGSDGTDGGPPSSPAPGTVTFTPTASGTPSTPVPPTASASATGRTLTPPPAPTVPASYPGGYTLTAAGVGSPVTGYLTSVDCAQDGSMSSDQLTITPGGTSVTLRVQPVPGDPITIIGAADLDAAGGVFRGADASRAITVTWVC